MSSRLRVLLQTVCVLLSARATVAQADPACGEWTVVSSPDPGASTGLHDIDASSASNVWILGGSGTSPLISRWDGSSWTGVEPPYADLCGRGYGLAAISLARDGAVWVGGSVGTTYPTWGLPLVCRREGDSWVSVTAITLRPQTVYPFADRGGAIEDMLVQGTRDIWAVGHAVGFGDGAATTVAMALHYDGSNWTDVEVPRPGNRTNYFTAAGASGADDIWAVGHWRNIASAYKALTMHWDGSEWIYVPNPAEDIGQTFLKAVEVIAPDDVWVGGHINYSTPFFMHWDGSSWSMVAAPPGGVQPQVFALAAVATDDIWAGDGTRGQLFHWDGVEWNLAPSPAPPADSFHSIKVMSAFGSCDVWAAGSVVSIDGGVGELVERLPAQAPTYNAEFLGEGQGASAMNESGEAVGNAIVANIRAWVASSGSPLALLPLPPGGVSSWAKDINDAGVIVGAVSSQSAPEFGGEAAAWVPDGEGGYTIELLGRLPGHVRSDATALNNVGDIVGYSSDGTFRYPVLFLGAGSVQDLSATGIFDPQDVNDQRRVVDVTVKRLNLDTMTVEDLGVPPGSYRAASAAAINEWNQVAGLAIQSNDPNCDRRAARYSDGVGWEILSACGSNNGAYDINDHGDVVMRLNLAPWVRFEGVGTFRIEDLIVPDIGHWYVVNSFNLAINNARQMVVWASNPATGEDGAVLLKRTSTPGDVNGDGVVDFADLLALLAAWGPCSPEGECPADLDGNGSVDFGDLLILLANWS